MRIQSQRTAIILLAIVCFIWGAEFTLIDMAVDVMPVNTFNAIRFSLAGLFLIPLFLCSKEALSKQHLLPLFIKGSTLGFLLFIAFYTQTEGLRHTSVSNAGFITGLASPMIPVLGFILFKKQVSHFVWVGILFATSGLYLLTVGDKLVFNQGDSLVLICALAFALHVLLTGLFVKSMPVIPLTIVQLFAVTIYSSLSILLSPDPAFYIEGHPPLTWQESVFSPVVITAILIAALLGTSFAYWAQATCQTILPDYKIALILTLEPVFAWLTAWLFLDERLGGAGLIGATCILTGIIVAETGEKLFINRSRTTTSG
jgi:drug/metabolite transporter (DMT)-like permease